MITIALIFVASNYKEVLSILIQLLKKVRIDRISL